jgi:hypothetical protein
MTPWKPACASPWRTSTRRITPSPYGLSEEPYGLEYGPRRFHLRGFLCLPTIPLAGFECAEPAQHVGELSEELECLVPLQRRGTDGQHGDRPTPVLDELGDRQVSHWGLTVSRTDVRPQALRLTAGGLRTPGNTVAPYRAVAGPYQNGHYVRRAETKVRERVRCRWIRNSEMEHWVDNRPAVEIIDARAAASPREKGDSP